MIKTKFLWLGILACPLFISCKNRLFHVVSGSMEATLHPGQAVYISNARNYDRNDIVVFDYFGNDYLSPPDENGNFKQHWEKRIYRIAAVSGDRLKIQKGELFINNQPVSPPAGMLMDYEVFSTVPIDDFPVRQNEPYQLSAATNNFHYRVQLTQREADDYKQRKPAILDVKKALTEYAAGDTMLIRSCDTCHWTTDEFGPLTIPLPGQTITVTEKNMRLYKNIPGIKHGTFLIKEKLYFLLGDNRHGAEDSRYIGFIPQSKIYGVLK